MVEGYASCRVVLESRTKLLAEADYFRRGSETTKPKSVAMKTRRSERHNPFNKLALALVGLSLGIVQSYAASYEWTFDSGNLSAGVGSGIMSYTGASAGLTTFGATGGGVPNIGGNTANYMHVPAFTSAANGYNLELANTGPNGGGSYVNNYTILFDVYIPGPWPMDYMVPFFNTNPNNGNDADFYLYGDGEIGIGGGGYSAPGTLAPNTWYRVAFVANCSAGTLSYYVNGTNVKTRGGVGLDDGTFALYSNLDPGADLLLFNEPTGLYTHELYLNSVAFVDHAMTGSELSALGGPNALGILVPEPSSISIALLGLLAGSAIRKRSQPSVG
jgi:hypothetical protein